ncbi:MAG: hypothetical protein JWR42_2240 [Marmoricola sp.]|nr:hypothetical protein [Marmoricola sp.]
MPKQTVSPWGFVGYSGLACVLFLMLATTVVVPWWVSVLFLLTWLVLLVLAGRWFLPHPTRVVWLAAVGFAVWAPIVSVGSRAWGWS